jgi:ketosteroid isomerase-like protein
MSELSPPSDSVAALPTQSDVEAWFRSMERCVRAVDYASARPLFAPEVVAFGTRAEIVSGLDALHARQWSQIWPTIRDFTFDLSQLRWGWFGEGGWAVVLWTSTGFRPDGTPFARPGRATLLFTRREGKLLAFHSHFSLAPG